MNIRDLIEERWAEAFALHDRYLNPQMVRMLKSIGFDRSYVRAEGPYLYDDQGNRYLDLHGGFGVYALGRNHPTVVETLQDVLCTELPNLVYLDAALLAGLLAERLVATMPDGLDRVSFANSGTEAVEAALKFSRYATGRAKLVSCENGYHGLTMGSLSLTGMAQFQDGFGPFLEDSEQIPFGDLEALERALSGKDVAAFIVEPIQGHGVQIPDDDYLPGAAELCRRYGTLLVADEIQTGLGRTGKFWAVEHWNVEPDLICTAKALSGGFVPVGAVGCRRWVFDKVFDRMDRAVVHGSTFGKNNLAMAAGLATLAVIDEENLIKNAARRGRQLLVDLQSVVSDNELLIEVRGLGMMIGLEFAEPESPSLKISRKLVEAAKQGLFCQMIVLPLLTRHRILSQVVGHDMHVVKFLPPMTIGDEDCSWIVNAVSDVVAKAVQQSGWNGRLLA